MADKKKMRLKGHETFILRDGWLTKGLYAVKQDSKVFAENAGADVLGVGTNMAKAIRYWMRESGLIAENTKSGASLTDLGRVILEEDPYFEDPFSLWLVHSNLVMNVERVTSWYMFFQQIESEEFTKDELINEMTKVLCQYAGVEELPTRSIQDDCTAILNMYLRDKEENYDPEDKKLSPFAGLGLLRKNGRIYRKNQPDYNQLDAMMVLYLLQKYFITDIRNYRAVHKCEEIQADVNTVLNLTTAGDMVELGYSISIDDLIRQPGLPGTVFNLKRVALNHYLDELAARNYIIVNRTAGLDMVYLNKVLYPEEVASLHYRKG